MEVRAYVNRLPRIFSESCIGGYGEGSSQQDLTYIINANGNNFVGVTIQYRLGAFGFLSSSEVFENGVVNAGILDQNFALKWV